MLQILLLLHRGNNVFFFFFLNAAVIVPCQQLCLFNLVFPFSPAAPAAGELMESDLAPLSKHLLPKTCLPLSVH